MNSEENRVSWQISVYKTDKKLIEFNDKLKLASVENYAHLHADGEKDGDFRISSLIGVVMQDYTNGTGDNLVRVTANLSPDDINFIFSRLSAGFQEVDFSQDKIFGEPDENGFSTVTKVLVKRATVGSDGKPRRYPWYFCVENGVGVKAKNANGGAYIAPKSYQRKTMVFANLSDRDVYCLLRHVVQYIQVWELTNGPGLIRKASQTKAESAQGNGQPVPQAG